MHFRLPTSALVGIGSLILASALPTLNPTNEASDEMIGAISSRAANPRFSLPLFNLGNIFKNLGSHTKRVPGLSLKPYCTVRLQYYNPQRVIISILGSDGTRVLGEHEYNPREYPYGQAPPRTITSSLPYTFMIYVPLMPTPEQKDVNFHWAYAAHKMYWNDITSPGEKTQVVADCKPGNVRECNYQFDCDGRG